MSSAKEFVDHGAREFMTKLAEHVSMLAEQVKIIDEDRRGTLAYVIAPNVEAYKQLPSSDGVLEPRKFNFPVGKVVRVACHKIEHDEVTYHVVMTTNKLGNIIGPFYVPVDVEQSNGIKQRALSVPSLGLPPVSELVSMIWPDVRQQVVDHLEGVKQGAVASAATGSVTPGVRRASTRSSTSSPVTAGAAGSQAPPTA
jgi:hypothetical protein